MGIEYVLYMPEYIPLVCDVVDTNRECIQCHSLKGPILVMA